MLEERDLSLMAAFSMQLAHLQQTTDSLEQQLSAILQATNQQAEEYQALIHIKSGLEREIEDYTVLLDINHDRYPVLTGHFSECTYPFKGVL